MRDGAVPKTTTQATIEETVETVQQTLSDASMQEHHPIAESAPEEQLVNASQYQEDQENPEPPKKKRGRKPKAEKELAKQDEEQLPKPETFDNNHINEAVAVPETSTPIPPEKKENPENQLLLKVLMAFPDVTFDMAKELLRTYGSLDAILTASKAELLDVHGLTDKAASAILWIMKRKWTEKK